MSYFSLYPYFSLNLGICIEIFSSQNVAMNDVFNISEVYQIFSISVNKSKLSNYRNELKLLLKQCFNEVAVYFLVFIFMPLYIICRFMLGHRSEMATEHNLRRLSGVVLFCPRRPGNNKFIMLGKLMLTSACLGSRQNSVAWFRSLHSSFIQRMAETI